MNFFPTTPKIFDEFIKLAAVVSQASHLLAKIQLGDTAAIKKIAASVQKLEQTADSICRDIVHQADTTFITPIDREDIHALKNDLNSIIDHIENVTTGISLYKVTKNGSTFQEFTKLVIAATRQVDLLIQELNYRDRHLSQMKKIIAELHKIEKQGDVMTRTAYAQLFGQKKSTITVLKWMQIFENLEIILDACEATADRVDEIIIKNF